jgi:hypothetical protein
VQAALQKENLLTLRRRSDLARDIPAAAFESAPLSKELFTLFSAAQLAEARRYGTSALLRRSTRSWVESMRLRMAAGAAPWIP